MTVLWVAAAGVYHAVRTFFKPFTPTLWVFVEFVDGTLKQFW
jgi:hypothetical protein